MKYNWEMIVDDLIRQCQEGEFKLNQPMPSEHTLAAKYNVSRIVIRNAYAYLKQIHYVKSFQGKGNYFMGIPNKITLNLISNQQSFSQKMERYGKRFSTKMICIKNIKDKTIQAKMNLKDDQEIVSIKRLRLMDNQVIALHCSYLPSSHFTDIEQSIMHYTSLYAYLKDVGYDKVTELSSNLVLEFIDPSNQAIMGINSTTPTICVYSLCSLNDKLKINLYSKIIYVADKFNFVL